MEILNLYPGSWASNCYLLISGSEAIVVDPSTPADKILAESEKAGAILKKIILTHGHFDHLLGLKELQEKTSVPAAIHRLEQSFPSDPVKNASKTFFAKNEMIFPRPETVLNEGDIIPIGKEKIEIIHTPGHTAGSICLLCGNDLLTGDTLFGRSVGRCDLFSGDETTLHRSLLKLSELPPELTIHSGHGMVPEKLGRALKHAL